MLSKVVKDLLCYFLNSQSLPWNCFLCSKERSKIGRCRRCQPESFKVCAALHPPPAFGDPSGPHALPRTETHSCPARPDALLPSGQLLG